MKYLTANIDLRQLSVLEDLSVRTVNICKSEGLCSLDKIISYYQIHKSFKRIRGCGTLTDKQLTDIYYKYKKSDLIDIKEDIDKVAAIIESFNARQKEIFDLSYWLALDITKTILNKKKKPIHSHKSKYIYKKSNKEISLFKKELNRRLYKMACEISNFEEEHMDYHYAVITVENILFGLTDYNRNNVNEFITNRNEIKIFKLSAFILNESITLKPAEQKIIKRLIFKVNGKSGLREIADEVGLSAERVRQIKVNLNKKLTHIFSFLENIDPDLIPGYTGDKNLIKLDSAFADLISEVEGEPTDPCFVSYILPFLTMKSHSIFDLTEHTIFYKSKKRKFKTKYLIPNKYYNLFDFDNFIIDFSKEFMEYRKIDFSLHIPEFVEQYMLLHDSDNFPAIYNICCKLIENEFKLTTNNNFIKFSGKPGYVYHEFIYNYLKKEGKPCHINHIIEELRLNFNSKIFNINSLRWNIYKDKRFIYFGRSSTYGLRIWEEEKDNVRGGTIREIAIKFINNYTHPVHVKDVLTEVRRYRPTVSERSLLANLEKDPRFEMLRGKFISFEANHITENTY